MNIHDSLIFAAFAMAFAGADAYPNQCQKPESTEAVFCTDCLDPKISPVSSKEVESEIPAVLSQASRLSAQIFATTTNHDKIAGLQPMPSREFRSERNSEVAMTTFDLDPQKQYQKMDGYGAAFTEACANNLLKLSPASRREVMERIFSKTKGAGFDLLRLPMGMSDFSDGSKPDYSYDDSPGNIADPNFKHFNMNRDEKIFEFIREAKKINPDLTVIVSPWSPPAWMKDSKSLRGGGLTQDHFEDYANYFVRTLREYEKRGIPVSGLTIQNEPGYSSPLVPTSGMSTADQAKFIGSFLGPKLAKEKIKVAIFAHDHNWDMSKDGPGALLQDETAKRYTAGVAYHCYGGYRWNMLDTIKKFPEVPTLQTECSGTLGSEAGGDFHWWLDNESLDAVKLGTTGALGWNLCLDESGGPRTTNSCDSCRGMITTDFSHAQPKVIYNGDYYAMAQVSRFIKKGSRRIEVGAEGVDNPKAVAFLNPDGTISFIAQNSGDKTAKIRIRLPNCNSISYDIPAMGAVSFVWSYRVQVNEAKAEAAVKSPAKE